ncbi:MAG: 50S ribosomal protein L18e [Candidatus Diapherotrites archaeon]
MKDLKKKKSTKELVEALKKASRERKEQIWMNLAERLAKPSRQLHSMNIEKISKLAEKNKGKILVIPGKALGKGELAGKAEVSAFSFSREAREKIGKNGKAMDLWELMESKKKAKEMTIVL